MKFKFIAFATLFFILNVLELKAQCPKGDVILTTQAEVIGFQRQYPNCTQISGDLIIGTLSTDIHDISPLSNIQRIDSSLTIRNCILLEDIEALNNVTFIGQDISLYGLENLRELTFLRNFSEVNNLNISNLQHLKNLDDLSSLEKISNSLTLSNLNVELPSVSSLTEIGEFVFLNYNLGMTNLDFFSELEFIKYVSIHNCDDLTDISGLNNIKNQVSRFSFVRNNSLNACAIDKICTSITQDSTIINLTNNGPECSDFNFLVEACGGIRPDCPIKGVTIYGQTELDAFGINYPNCTTLESLSIQSATDDEIIDFSPLSNIKTIQKSLSISNNFLLEDLSGLEKLDSLGSLYLNNNDNLKSLKGLEQLQSLESLHLRENNSIKDIGSIDYGNLNLNSIYLYDNITLTDISPIGAIDSLDNLFLDNNHSISNFNQLDGIQYIRTFLIRNLHGFTQIEDNFINQLSIDHLDIRQTESLSSIDFGTSIKLLDDINIYDAKGLIDIKLNTYGDKFKNISITSNKVLESIDLGSGPESIFGRINIASNGLLKNINLPTKSQFIKAIFISSNYELSQIRGGNNLIRMHDLNVRQNSLLTDINGLNHPIVIDSISISGNRALDNCAIEPLCIIPNLKYLFVSSNKGPCESSVIAVGHCPQNIKNPFTDVVITSLNDLNILKEAYPNADSIHGNLTFADVVDISDKDLDYFKQIEHIDSNLIFRGCNIQNLNDFGHLQFKNLEIRYCDHLDSLPFFYHLKNANHVIIQFNDSLKSIIGLDSLVTCDEFELRGNPLLTSLAGLEKLRRTYRLELDGLPISDVKPLANLKQMGFFRIDACKNLTTLKDFENLESVKGGWIWDNTNLKSLFITLPIDTLHSALWINNNNNLAEISGFENIKYINGYINIIGANEVVNLNTFPNLESTGSIKLRANFNMTNFEFPNLKELRHLEVSSNTNLQTFSNLSILRSLEGKLEIRLNPELVDIRAFSDSLTVDYIEILNNPKLDDCSLPFICEHLKRGKKINFVKNSTNCITEAIVENACDFIPKKCPSIGYIIDENLTSQVYNDNYVNCRILNGNLLITDNVTLAPQLQNLNVIVGNNKINCSGLEQLSYDNLTFITGEFVVDQTNTLESLSFPKLERIGNSITHYTPNFEITNNNDLRYIPELNKLVSTKTYMLISNNNKLTTISGFENIGYIAKLVISENPSLSEMIEFDGLTGFDELIIHDNENLSNLEAFNHIFDADYITAYNNPSLSFCSVKGFCHHVDNDRDHDFYNNLSGCNSRAEILEHCTVSVLDEEFNELDVNIYPNPTDGFINVATPLEINQIQILDAHGRLINMSYSNDLIDLSEVDSGIYMLFIHTPKGISKHKVIVTKI